MWLHFLSTKIQNREFPHRNTRLLGRLPGRSPETNGQYTKCLLAEVAVTIQADYRWDSRKVWNVTAHDTALVCSTGAVMNPITEDWGCQTGDSVITKKAWSVPSGLALAINWKQFSGQSRYSCDTFVPSMYLFSQISLSVYCPDLGLADLYVLFYTVYFVMPS